MIFLLTLKNIENLYVVDGVEADSDQKFKNTDDLSNSLKLDESVSKDSKDSTTLSISCDSVEDELNKSPDGNLVG